MKTISQITLFLALIFVTSGSFAQGKYKFGHINSYKLLEVMPEREAAQAELQKYASELEEALTAMQKEYDEKYNAYMAEKDSMSDFIKKKKEEEIMMIGQRIEAFRSEATQNVQTKEAALLEPIFKKAKDGIAAVAKENSLTYVFEVAEGAGGGVLFFSEDSQDILPLVKKKLGIE